MTFTKNTELDIKSNKIKIGYVDTTCEEFGSVQHPGGQGAALEVISIILGFIGGTVASGILKELGKDIYSKVKSFFLKEKEGIDELKENFQKQWSVYCYSFNIETEFGRIILAFDVSEIEELEFAILKGEKIIIEQINEALKDEKTANNIIIEVDIANRGSFHKDNLKVVQIDNETLYVSYKLIGLHDKEHWSNNLVLLKTSSPNKK